MSFIKKFNQFTMNEEYRLPIERTEQQLMIKEIVKNINPNFNVLFNNHTINISINNKNNQSGKFDNKLDIHKVHNTLGDFIKLEKALFDSGIIEEQLPELQLDFIRTTVLFSV